MCPAIRFLPVALSVIAMLLAGPAVERAAAQPAPVAADLGTCRLESGDSLPGCRVTYRVFGQMNERRSNIVLVPTWLAGRSEHWISLLGPAGLLDTSALHVVVVDALANGSSSSPSNSRALPGIRFPALTIADMVQSQLRLLTEHLGVQHLHAVVGVSMGGMQALEWAVRYPAFVDRVVSIVGPPRLSAYSQAHFALRLSIVETGRRYGVPEDSIWLQVARLNQLVSSTPRAVDRIPMAGLDSALRTEVEGSRAWMRADALEDFTTQTRAVLRYDVSAPFGGDLARAARAVRARMLVVYSWDDHVAGATSSATFARLLKADTLAVPSACGHGVFVCETGTIGAAVRTFLAP
jgi:homoserine O-acetyltransferase